MDIWEILNKREMRVLPGNIAFFFMLALIPIITIVVYLASYFSISVEAVSTMVKNLLPGDTASTIVEIISGKSFDGNIGLFNLATIVVATNGTYSIVNASNTLYRVKNSDRLRDRVKSVWIFVIMLVLMLFILVVPIFGDKIVRLCAKIRIFSDLSDKIMVLFNIIKWPISIFIIYFNVKLIYIIAPSTEVKSNDTTYGAIFTTVGWSVATLIFSWYLKCFAHYDIIYGNLSSIIILMMWLYILAYIFVLGLAINTKKLNKIEG